MQTEVMQEGKIQGKRGISSAVLKNIAVVTMLIDHSLVHSRRQDAAQRVV